MNKNNFISDLILRKYNQRKNTQKLTLDTPNSINKEDYVKIGGIEQWISIRGEDLNNPILFFIHGGPASPYSIFSPLIRSWEKYFTIVQWDQRGAGKTFGKNKKDKTDRITFEQLVKDGIELTEYICNALQQPKVILIGSSLGSLIGIMMIKQKPELYYAYIGTDQNALDDGHTSYKLALNALHQVNNKKGIEFIKKMGPDETLWTRKEFDKRNQIIVYAMKDVPNMIMDLMLPSMLSSPTHNLIDIVDIFKGMKFSLNHLYDEIKSFHYERLGTEFKIPFLIFQGDSDIITPVIPAQKYFNRINAPYKEFVLINKAGHLACFANPDQFLVELKNRVIPLLH